MRLWTSRRTFKSFRTYSREFLLSSGLTPRPGFRWRLAQWHSGGLWIRFSEVRFLQRLEDDVIQETVHHVFKKKDERNPRYGCSWRVLERWPSMVEGDGLLSRRGHQLSAGSNPALSVCLSPCLTENLSIEGDRRNSRLSEWPMVAVLKTADAKAPGGSNPSPAECPVNVTGRSTGST